MLAQKKQDALPDFPVGETLEIWGENQILKELVLVVFPTDDYWNISLTRCISVLADMFSKNAE